MLSGKETQDFYNELKNEFLCYNKVNSKISWSHELFKYGKYKLGLLKVKGKELIGCKLSAPLSVHKEVYLFPMETISMAKGTGIVTSVPSGDP